MQISNANIIIRCDFNEPLKGGTLLSTGRIDANLTTVYELLAKKNRLILISHHSDKEQTLLPVYNYIKKEMDKSHPKINFVYINSSEEDVVNEYFLQNKNNLPEIILIENTRLFKNENSLFLDETNSDRFAKFLSTLGSYFVYDAFSVGHRDHASTTGIAKILPSSFGNTFLREYSNLKKLGDESTESLIIMGGAKLSTKLPIIEKFLTAGATVCVGGAMAHPILKLQGVDIKNSFTEEGAVIAENVYNHKNLILPNKSVWNVNDIENPNTKIIDSIFDTEHLEKLVQGGDSKNIQIKNILWNGPVGMYEDGNIVGTDIIKNFLEKMYADKINTVVGGGDTLTYLEKYQEFKASYMSLSGGAMLTFLSDGTLPILKNIEISD